MSTIIYASNCLSSAKYIKMEENLPFEQCTAPALQEAAENTKLSLLPEEYRQNYINEYLTFKQWKDTNIFKQTTESVLIAYFNTSANESTRHSLLSILNVEENYSLPRKY